MPTYTSKGSGGDILLAHAVPEAEYMYGCTPTAAAMLLGYYDLYGYRGTSLSNIIECDVDLKSRGTDGNAYDMDAFDTVLGRATATEEYVYRFYSRNGKETTPEQELAYSFKSDGKTLDTSIWNCLADYLGTGQYWRGNGNLSTSEAYCSLEKLYTYDNDITISDDTHTKTVKYYETAMLYGLDLYVQSRGYAMDYEITGTYQVDVAGGSFTFEDYMREINSGRPVLIAIKGHSMIGYGYNPETREIIFDDCYNADSRMKWNGTYFFSGSERTLKTITVIGINVNGDMDLALVVPDGCAEKVTVAGTTGATETPDYIFEGTAAYLTYAISNLGSKESRDFRTSIRDNGELVSSASVYSIPKGTTRKTANVPLGKLSVGMHNVRVIVDEANDIQELTASNNTAEASILVLKSGTSILTSRNNTVNSWQTVYDVYVAGDTTQSRTLNISSGSALGVILRGKIASSSAEGGISFFPGKLNLMEDGYASGVDVYAYGSAAISSGGTAVNTHVFSKGSAFVRNGGVASDMAVESGGKLFVSSGGKLTGRIQIESGASATVWSESILDFDLASVEPGAEARLNDVSRIKGTPIYTLTVSGSQQNGKYTLAGGAAGFDQAISVVGTDGVKLGELNVGETADIGGTNYKLKLSLNGVLTVTVGATEMPPLTAMPFFVGDFAGTGKAMLAKESGGTISIYADGACWGTTLTPGDGWNLAEAGDLNGDGTDDLLLLHSSGLLVGGLSNGDGTFSQTVLTRKDPGWDLLGTGDFNGSGADDLLATDPEGISDNVGMLGFWEGGVEWNLSAGYSGDWEPVTVGDFNGDGTDDMLWRTTVTDGEGTLCYGYCTWLMGLVSYDDEEEVVDWKRIGAIAQDEWEFLGAGDFNGNGTSDIAMLGSEGVVTIWEIRDGTVRTYTEAQIAEGKSAKTALGEVNTAEWGFAGIGDFNGDGTDDLAWCSLSTGTAEYWQINDKKLSARHTIGVIA